MEKGSISDLITLKNYVTAYCFTEKLLKDSYRGFFDYYDMLTTTFKHSQVSDYSKWNVTKEKVLYMCKNMYQTFEPYYEKGEFKK